jgi:hypothetical protein
MPRNYLAALIILCFSIVCISCSKSTSENSIVTPPVTPPSDTTPTSPSKEWIVSTFAGSGDEGFEDGTGLSAKFKFPSCMSFDTSGNLFVGDGNFAVRKITPAGEVSTYAGRSIYDPPGLEYGNISGVQFDFANNLYIIDYSFIRQIKSPVETSIFTGSLQLNFIDGSPTQARFNIISDMAVDQANNIYVPDFDMQDSFRIREVDPSGFVTTLAITDNTGFPSVGGAVYYISSIAVDKIGNIYVTANGNCMIKKITPDGVASIFAGAGNIGFTDGKGQAAQFYNINGLAIDNDGNVWATDAGNNAVRKITPDGTVTTIAGGTAGFADGNKSQAKFNIPNSIAVDKNNVVYVSDMLNQRIRKLEYK